MIPGSVAEVRFAVPLALAIASTAAFWGIGTLTGIAGITLCVLASRREKMGDIEGARSRVKLAAVLAVAGIVLTIVLDTVLWQTGVITIAGV